jgi:TetR/AcrR family transcriptional regulator, regulator of cefoperazone and chloramphenicol sensitivity
MTNEEAGMLAHKDEQQNEACRRLLAAASEEFARHGYASARIRQIVDAAKVNLAAVNYYFGGKEGLYRATLRHLAIRPAPPAKAVANRRGDTPEERLHRRVFAILDRFIGTERPSPLGRILAHEAMDPTRNVESLIRDTMRPEVEHIHELLREIAGPDVADTKLAHAALGVLGQCLLYLYARPTIEDLSPGFAHGQETCRSLAGQITEFSLGGIERLQRASGAQK